MAQILFILFNIFLTFWGFQLLVYNKTINHCSLLEINIEKH